MDESNATCGKRLASIGLENTEANRQAYRTLLVTAPGLGQYISGAILFEETLYQSTTDGKKIVDVLVEQNIMPGIKVDKVKTHNTKNFLSVSFCGLNCLFDVPIEQNSKRIDQEEKKVHFYCFCLLIVRVLYHLLAQTTNPGAKDWMAWHQGAQRTTNKAPASPNGDTIVLLCEVPQYILFEDRRGLHV